ncbi:MAG: HipA domain-containing protein [Candidatus Desulfofervidaceae bacterium]|nr:HipA domain-containing protein [Candidatus Desulfofervidaceae bacterium]
MGKGGKIMNCGICGNGGGEEKGYHRRCLKALFGSPILPEIRLKLSDVSLEAQKMAGKISISGVQPKLVLSLDKKCLVSTPSGGLFILKPQTETFRNLPENENICMNIAGRLGITVPPHGLFQLADGTWAYVVRRFDRTLAGEKKRCEDFSQVLGLDKYTGSIEQVGRKILDLSEFPGIDAQLLFERVLLNFLLGNGDAHLKNYSILEDDVGNLRLSPAYDIVCSKLVIPSEEDSALTINGKRNCLGRIDFEILSDYLRIPDKASADIFRRMSKIREAATVEIGHSLLDDEGKEVFLEIVEERFSRIMGAGHR